MKMIKFNLSIKIYDAVLSDFFFFSENGGYIKTGSNLAVSQKNRKRKNHPIEYIAADKKVVPVKDQNMLKFLQKYSVWRDMADTSTYIYI